jgi:hypothetical protein
MFSERLPDSRDDLLLGGKSGDVLLDHDLPVDVDEKGSDGTDLHLGGNAKLVFERGRRPGSPRLVPSGIAVEDRDHGHSLMAPARPGHLSTRTCAGVRPNHPGAPGERRTR